MATTHQAKNERVRVSPRAKAEALRTLRAAYVQEGERFAAKQRAGLEEVPNDETRHDEIDTVIDALIDLRQAISLTELRLHAVDPEVAGPMLLMSLGHIQRDLRAAGIQRPGR